MKRLLLLPFFLIAACEKSGSSSSQTETPPETESEKVAAPEKPKTSAKTSKAEKSRDAAPAPEPPPKRLAPDGIYYVTERLAFTTDDGAFTVKAGTRVTLVKNNDKTMEVSDGQRTFTVQPFQVTNDLDAAAQIGKAAATEASASQAANRERNQQVASIVSQQQNAAAQAQASSEAAVARKRNEARLTALKAEQTTLNAKIEEANDAERRFNYGRNILNRAGTVPTIVTQRPAMQARLKTVSDEILRLTVELAR